jgi:hypothetical protein
MAIDRGVLILLVLALLQACGGGGSSPTSAKVASENELSNISAYRSSAPFAGILSACVKATTPSDYCSLTDLPLLIDEAEVPSVDQIMSRVVVSHPWMGQRLEQVLATMPDELLRLFGAVTAIVVDDDIRPAYYQPEISTIFLDAQYLWLTNTEKAVIDQQPDYRSSFDDELSFISLARHIDGFNRAWESYSLSDDEERELGDIRLNVARLLLHELMHANDFFPPSQTPYLDPALTVYQALQQLSGDRISTQLEQALPLESEQLKGLAAVMYKGEVASSAQKGVTALQVGQAFVADGANDDYAYSSRYEDVAMLFSESMMKYLFDIDRDVAYADRPASADYSCDELIVAWGMRGRIGGNEIKPRAQFVLERVYLAYDFSLFFQDLALPKMMRVDESWCDNLALF